MNAPTLTERIDASMVASGHDPECVRWVCLEHRRHCAQIDTPHIEHTCYWCSTAERAEA